jgi:hypothetical protein
MHHNMDIELDPEDGVTEAIAVELIEDLRDEGSDAEVLATCDGISLVDGLSLVALVGLALTTASGIAVLASFLYRVFRVGITINLKGKNVRIQKNKDLPRGSVLIVHPDGTTELREGVNQSALADHLVKVLLANSGSTGL